MEVQTLAVIGESGETISLHVETVKDGDELEGHDGLSEDNNDILAVAGIENVEKEDEAGAMNSSDGSGAALVMEQMASSDPKQNNRDVSFAVSIPDSCMQELEQSQNGIGQFIVEDGAVGTIENGSVLHCLGNGKTIMLPSGMIPLDGGTLTLTNDVNGREMFTILPQESLQIDSGHEVGAEESDNDLGTTQSMALSGEGPLKDDTATYTIGAGVLENPGDMRNFNANAISLETVKRTLQLDSRISDPVMLDDSQSALEMSAQLEREDGLLGGDEQSSPAERDCGGDDVIALDQQQGSSNDSGIRDTSTPNNNEHGQEKDEDDGNSAQQESEANANTVVIDISNPIQLCQNSLITVNGQKCVLQQNPETGQLFAYPIKEPEKPRKKRGRPRKVRADPQNSADESKEAFGGDAEAEMSDEDLEKGMVEKSNEAGEIVKRSSRKRKKNYSLIDYETSLLDLENVSDDHDDVDEDDLDSPPAKKRNKTKVKPKKEKAVNPNETSSTIQDSQSIGRRKRGRPRRYGLPTTDQQPSTQAFLIQLSDGQTVMMQVPSGNLPPGITIQSIAQSIADSLQNSQSQAKSLPAIAPRPSKAITGNSSCKTNVAVIGGKAAGGQIRPLRALVSADNDSIKISSVVPETDEQGENITSKDVMDSTMSLGPAASLLNSQDISLLDGNLDDKNKGSAFVDVADESPSSGENSIVEANTSSQMDAGDPNSGHPLPQKVVPIILSKPETPIKIGLKASEVELEKLRCPKCDFQAYYQQQYQDHLALHPDDVHRCKCCSYLALEEEDLFGHYKDNHPKCICTICNHTAEHAYIIKRHMYRHNDMVCTCALCGKTYKDHYILKMHMKMVHLPAEVLFECDVCRKKFTRKAHLKRHLRTHDPDKPYKCSICEYRGCEKSDITKHMLIHEEPKHACEVCGKSFRHVKNKELHVKRHKGQRDYKCGVCNFHGYTFTDIRKHIERKHADAKIVCDRCGQTFKTEASIKEHQNSGQCELFMLDQSNQDAANKTGSIETSTELQEDSANITTITLPDGSLATLSDFASSGQIILTDDDGQLQHSQLIDQNGQLAIVTNRQGIVAMVTDQGELNTEFALVTEGDDVAMVTEEAAMLTEMMDAGADDENEMSGEEEPLVAES